MLWSDSQQPVVLHRVQPLPTSQYQPNNPHPPWVGGMPPWPVTEQYYFVKRSEQQTLASVVWGLWDGLRKSPLALKNAVVSRWSQAQPADGRRSRSLLEKLPLDILNHICDFLPLPKDLVNLSSTCKSLDVALGSNNHLWYRFFIRNEDAKQLEEKYSQFTREELYGLAFIAPQEVYKYMYIDAFESAGPDKMKFHENYAASFYNIWFKGGVIPSYSDEIDYRKSIARIMRWVDFALYTGERRMPMCQGCMKPGNWLPEGWQMTFSFLREERNFLGSAKETTGYMTYCKDCAATNLLYAAPLAYGPRVPRSICPTGAFSFQLSSNLENKRRSGVRSFAQAHWTAEWEHVKEASVLNQSICRVFSDAKRKGREDTHLRPDSSAGLRCDWRSTYLHLASDISKEIKIKCGLSLEERRKTINSLMDVYTMAFPRLCDGIHTISRGQGNLVSYFLLQNGEYDEDGAQRYLQSQWHKFSGHWTYPPSERKTIKENMAYYRLIPNYPLRWCKSPTARAPANPRTEDFSAVVIFLSPAPQVNIFDILGLPPSGGDLDKWISTSASTIVERCFSDPTIPLDPNAAIEGKRLSYIEAAIRDYCDRKFRARQHGRAGRCRYCDSDMWYTPFYYALHLYLQHTERFTNDTKFMWKTGSMTKAIVPKSSKIEEENLDIHGRQTPEYGMFRHNQEWKSGYYYLC